MGWGDEIVAAGQAQRLYEQMGRPVVIVGVDDKPRWHPLWDGNPVIVRPEAYARNPTGVAVLRSGPHCRPYIVYPFTVDSGWTFNRAFRCRDHVATLSLTEAERARGVAARQQYGPYVLIEPYTKHENFRWPLRRWAALVRACKDITFVQHVHADSERVPGAHYEPATFREACGLIASASCYVRSESGLCHAAAALQVPQVTLFGGCMDPEVMGFYPGQTVIADTGDGSPCGSWQPCQHCQKAMAGISVDMVADALRAHLQAKEDAA